MLMNNAQFFEYKMLQINHTNEAQNHKEMIKTLRDHAGLSYVKLFPVVILEALGNAALGLEGVLEVVVLPVRTTAVLEEATDEKGRSKVRGVVLFPTLAIYFIF
jgi:hypothetical protein